MENQVTGVVTLSKAAGIEQRPGVDIAIVTRGKEDATCASSRSRVSRRSHEALDHDITCVPTVRRGEENASCLSGRSRSSRLSLKVQRLRAAAEYRAEEELFKLKEGLIRQRLALRIAEIEGACYTDVVRVDVPPAPVMSAGTRSNDVERVDVPPTPVMSAGTRSSDVESVDVQPTPVMSAGMCSTDVERENVPPMPAVPSGACSNDVVRVDVPPAPVMSAGTRSNDVKRVDVPPTPVMSAGTRSNDVERVDVPPTPVMSAGTRLNDVERVDVPPMPVMSAGTCSTDGKHVDLPPTPPAPAGSCSSDGMNRECSPRLAHVPHAATGAHVSFALDNRNQITAPARFRARAGFQDSTCRREPARRVHVTNEEAASSSASSQASVCALCNSAGHRLPECGMFINKSEKEKWDFVKDIKLCFKCFVITRARYKCRAIRWYKCRSVARATPPPPRLWAPQRRWRRPTYERRGAQAPPRRRRVGILWAPQRRRRRPTYERRGTQAPPRRRRVGNEYG